MVDPTIPMVYLIFKKTLYTCYNMPIVVTTTEVASIISVL